MLRGQQAQAAGQHVRGFRKMKAGPPGAGPPGAGRRGPPGPGMGPPQGRMGGEQQLDYEIVDATQAASGQGSVFRFIMFLFFLAIVGTLMWWKFQGETIEPPERDADEEESQRVAEEDAAEKYFNMMNEERTKMTKEEMATESAAERKQRIREQKKAAKEAFEKHEEKYNSGDCDEECRKNHQAITLSFNQISSVVEEDYYKVLDIKSKLSKTEIREKYNDIKEKIEKGDESVSGMDLAEVTEAYGVLMNNEARMYYNLYGMKPPAFMKHNSQFARHGGWGQEFQTQAWKVKKLLAWLTYFDSKSADLTVLFVIVAFSAIPIVFNLRELLHKLKEVYPELQPNYEEHAEKMHQLREDGQRKATRRGGGRRL